MMRSVSRAGLPALLLALALPAVASVSLEAQDVELLGRIHGTRPPDAYFELRERDPDAYELGRAWRARTGLGPPERDPDVPGAAARAADFRPRDRAVEGTFAFPMVLALFADSDFGGTDEGPHSVEEVQREFFDGPSSRFATISDYYAEVSDGRVELLGETVDWLRSDLERSEVTGGQSGLGSQARVGELVRDLVGQMDDAGMDWARYDNDGPDGIPDSGDDDGHVDIVAVMHPTAGAECDSDPNKVWSHKWRLSSSTGRAYATSETSANGDSIRVDDYVIVPVKACGGSDLNEIGVFVHELGHAFGLPDLYGTGGSDHFGAGSWGLMGTGAWGCGGDGSTPNRPCRPGAWTKSVLGWASVDTVDAGADERTVDLLPVASDEGGVVLVRTNDGSGEYFLLEHRIRDGGFDAHLYEEGLLIWHVDPEVVAARWSSNRVNSDPDRPGVWLRQADGNNDLMRQGGGRGDAGDPFPGSVGRRVFHAGSVPASVTHAGNASGLTITGIDRIGDVVRFDLSNFYHTVSLRTEETSQDTTYFSVDGAPAQSAAHEFPSAPFERHVIEAAGGAVVAEGVRESFVRWEDGSESPVRDFQTRSDTVLVARYGGERQLHFDVAMVAESDTVTPGVLTFEPGTADGWVPEDDLVSVKVEARNGFAFDRWGGAFDGRPQEFMVEATDPLQASAHFDVTYAADAVATPIEVAAATSIELELETVNGTEPVVWGFAGGALPEGLALESDGRIHGAALRDGTFEVTLRARDDIGLEALVELEFVVDPPRVGLSTLTEPFLFGGSEPGETGPTALQEAYMDRSGNRDGSYDVGDFRAFLRDHPDTPEDDPAAAPSVGPELPPVLLKAPNGPTPDERDEEGGER